MPIIRIIFVRPVLISIISIGNAQDKLSPASSENNIEQLQKKLDEQEKQFKLLQETLQKQIDSLQTKFESKESSPTTVPTTNTQSAEVKPSPRPVNHVESGFGKIKFDGLIQAWYSAGNGINNTLRPRRNEMKFSGQINP